MEIINLLSEALLAYPEWTDDLDETACPTGWVYCVICQGGGSQDKRKKLPPTHNIDCKRLIALNALEKYNK